MTFVRWQGLGHCSLFTVITSSSLSLFCEILQFSGRPDNKACNSLWMSALCVQVSQWPGTLHWTFIKCGLKENSNRVITAAATSSGLSPLIVRACADNKHCLPHTQDNFICDKNIYNICCQRFPRAWSDYKGCSLSLDIYHFYFSDGVCPV